MLCLGASDHKVLACTRRARRGARGRETRWTERESDFIARLETRFNKVSKYRPRTRWCSCELAGGASAQLSDVAAQPLLRPRSKP